MEISDIRKLLLEIALSESKNRGMSLSDYLCVNLTEEETIKKVIEEQERSYVYN